MPFDVDVVPVVVPEEELEACGSSSPCAVHVEPCVSPGFLGRSCDGVADLHRSSAN